ncbi:hypothetical protein [Crocinitomix catalasitica]|uniref:hypothetical protein n=1 Tax=Crocinitomix catalasitica TaxID=184607 RepID=UPI00047F74A1|nr:hypothetical protein [Crocinitomix catalasitica]
MKKFILFTFCLIEQFSFGQQINKTSFISKTKFEFTTQSLLFFKPTGFMIRAKKEIFKTNHFEAHAGIGLRTFNLKFKKDATSLGDEQLYRSSGFSILTDFQYYPFKSKGFFIGIEPFIGVSRLKTKSSFKKTGLNVDVKHEFSTSFFDYGTNHSFGYSLNKWSLSANIMLSHRGLYV